MTTLDEIEASLRLALRAVEKARELGDRKEEIARQLAGAALERVMADPFLGPLFERALGKGR